MSNKTIKTISVSVKYTVGLGGVEIPQEIADLLDEAANEGITLGSDTAGGRHNKYAEAASWLSDNIREADCMDWEADIDDLEFDE